MEKAIHTNAKNAERSSRLFQEHPRQSQRADQHAGGLAELAALVNGSPLVQAQLKLADGLQNCSRVEAQFDLAAKVNAASYPGKTQLTQLCESDSRTEGAIDEPNLRAPGPPVVQCGGILGLAGIDDAVETKAQGSRFEGTLRYAVQAGIDPAIVNIIFTHVSNGKLEKDLPEEDPPGIWEELTRARDVLGQGAFNNWVAKAGLKVLDIPELQMLLTDESTRGAQEQAKGILEHAHLLPPFAGVAYDAIVATLQRMGYTRQEKYQAVSDNDIPYGQDVWTSDDNMVVRIKVGGRSIHGRFPRPAHVVKEITKEAHTYSPADIIAKLTDTNVLIPAGTKYSARDIQTWYNQNAGGNLAEDAWQDPEASGDNDFIALFHRWTEGAHTAIGAVPPVPTSVTERQRQLLNSYRSAVEMIHDFDGTRGKIEGIVAARGQNPEINATLQGLSNTHLQRVQQALSAAEDVVYESNFKVFYSKRQQIKDKLEAWRGALDTHLSNPPDKPAKRKDFYKKLFDDAKKILDEHDTSGWEKLKNPDKK